MLFGDESKNKAKELANAQHQLDSVIGTLQGLKSKQKLETVQAQSLAIAMLDAVNRATETADLVKVKLQEAQQFAAKEEKHREKQKAKLREVEFRAAEKRLNIAKSQVARAAVKFQFAVDTAEQIVATSKEKLQDWGKITAAVQELKTEQEMENVVAEYLEMEVSIATNRILDVIDQVTAKLKSAQAMVVEEEHNVEAEQEKLEAIKLSGIQEQLLIFRKQASAIISRAESAMLGAEVKHKSSKTLSTKSLEVATLKEEATEAYTTAEAKLKSIHKINDRLKSLKVEQELESGTAKTLIKEIQQLAAEVEKGASTTIDRIRKAEEKDVTVKVESVESIENIASEGEITTDDALQELLSATVTKDAVYEQIEKTHQAQPKENQKVEQDNSDKDDKLGSYHTKIKGVGRATDPKDKGVRH